MSRKNKQSFFGGITDEELDTTVYKDTDNVYLNIFISNTGNQPISAEYSAQQNKPILDNMNDYEAGIVRMKIPTASIPLMIFEDNQYWIGFVIGQNDEHLLGPLPVVLMPEFRPNNSNGSPADHYIYYYSQFLGCINDILRQLWVLAIADSAPPAPPNPYQAVIPAELQHAYMSPVFKIVDTTSYIDFIAPSFRDNADPAKQSCPFHQNGIQIIMSNKLFYFFSGFPAKYYGITPIAGDVRLNYKLQLYADQFNNTGAVRTWNHIASYNTVKITQDYPSLFLWNTLSRVFITSSIALEKEYILVKGDQGSSKKFEILTDFELPDDSSSKGLREYIYVQPTIIRWINFKSSGQLDKMDLKIYFQTKDLDIYQLYIPPSFEATAKIRFRRRQNRNLLQHTIESKTGTR